MTHGSLGKKIYLIYTTTRRKQTNPFRQWLQWMKDVQHLIATMHTLSVQILKYSSLRFGCFFNNELCWMFMYKGLCDCFLLYFSYSQLLIKFPRCSTEAKAATFEHFFFFWKYLKLTYLHFHREYTEILLESR